MPFITVVTPATTKRRTSRRSARGPHGIENLPARNGEPYTYEHIFIDNASIDRTVDLLRGICADDKRVKVIVNTRNFGHIRSPFHGLLQAQGEAVIVSWPTSGPAPDDRRLHIRWDEGYKVVVGVKTQSEENRAMFFFRRLYYRVIDRLSDVPQIRNFTGFGLYDRVVIDTLREIDDPYPYFRGLISELGYARVEVPYSQPSRRGGISKNNFYSLYGLAMLGITNHSKVPLRVAAIAGFALAVGGAAYRLRLPGPQAGMVGHVRPRLGASGDRACTSSEACSSSSSGCSASTSDRSTLRSTTVRW